MKKLPMLLVLLFTILVSCTKEEIFSEDSQNLKSQKLDVATYVYKNETFKIQLNEDGSLNKTGLTYELKKIISSKNVAQLADDQTIYLFDSVREINSFYEATYGEFKENKLRSAFGVMKVKLYKGYNLSGLSWILDDDESVSSLGFGFDNQISSGMGKNTGNRGYVLKLYSEKNYKGILVTKYFRPQSTDRLVDFRHIGFDNVTSSIRLSKI